MRWGCCLPFPRLAVGSGHFYLERVLSWASSAPRVVPHLLCPRTWTTFPFPVSPPRPHPLPSKLRARGRGGALEAFGTRLLPAAVTSFQPRPRLEAAFGPPPVGRVLSSGRRPGSAGTVITRPGALAQHAVSSGGPRDGKEPAPLLPGRPP